ncbi:hypothetical protein HYU20_02460 [Candidatus Woesearchaeota archaeon]|nr:hypothetical protein [Candidatus Woesearchaeota archaeon]
MIAELDLEHGISTAIELLGNIKERPLYVAIRGEPNAGKSYFIDRLANELELRGLSPSRLEYGPHPIGLRAPQLISSHDVFFYHACYASTADLNIGIYNPNFHSGPKEYCDIIISNPQSVRK